jgi:hypothetical protein
MFSLPLLLRWLCLLSMVRVSALGDTYPPPAHLTAEQDHQRTLELLQIAELRQGPDGDPKSRNAANFDESRVSAKLNLPDPLVSNNGERVTFSKMWWTVRRPEIVEAFDREVYGRVPSSTPSVRWEVLSSTSEQVGGVPVTTKTLVGHVDNSSYPLIRVDIQLTLTTPAKGDRACPCDYGTGTESGGLANDTEAHT